MALAVGVYRFEYTPEIHEEDFKEANMYRYNVTVEAFNARGKPIGGPFTTQWRVIRP